MQEEREHSPPLLIPPPPPPPSAYLFLMPSSDQDLPQHLEAVASAMEEFYRKADELTQEARSIFPIDMDVKWRPMTEQYVASRDERLRPVANLERFVASRRDGRPWVGKHSPVLQFGMDNPGMSPDMQQPITVHVQ